MTGIRVTGANWDTAMLDSFASDPPPRGSSRERHRFATERLVTVIGTDLRRFFRCHGARYAAHWRGPDDPFAAMVSWLADYFLRLHEFLVHGPAAVANWAEALAAARGLGQSTRLVVGMQLGHPLLLPVLAEAATGRPAYPIVHDRNPAVLEMYQRRLRLGGPILLTALSPADLRRWLDTGGLLMANVDTSYPGTRQVHQVPFLGGRLAMPTGLVSLAARRGLETRTMAGPGSGGRISVTVGPPLPADPEQAVRGIGATFARLISAYPEQWLAWGSLRDDPAPAGGHSQRNQSAAA